VILDKFRIPTLFGLIVLVSGLAAGVYLTLQSQTITTKAAPEVAPKSIFITNLGNTSASISWLTDTPTSGFITFGKNSPEGQTALDDRDKNAPSPRVTHHVTLRNLDSDTTYKLKIFSNKASITHQLTTTKDSNPDVFNPIIGSVLEDENPLLEGIVYLQINGEVVRSAPIINLGNFIIPLSNFTMPIGSEGKLNVTTGTKSGSATFTFKDDLTLPPLKIGQNLDFTNTLGVSTSKDKNGDGVINAFDLIQKPTHK
jgi:hypothetical protein